MKRKLLSLSSLMIGFFDFPKPKFISNMMKRETKDTEESMLLVKQLKRLFQKKLRKSKSRRCYLAISYN
jgi:hypothetical protein